MDGRPNDDNLINSGKGTTAMSISLSVTGLLTHHITHGRDE